MREETGESNVQSIIRGDGLMEAMNKKTGIRQIEMKGCFSDSLLDVMNFLASVIYEYPRAISFAPGRPLEEFFQVEKHVEAIRYFVSRTAQKRGKSEDQVWQELGQYSQTNGMINDLIAQHLEVEEGIRVPEDAIIVTVGAQEAMAVILLGLFEATDFLLVGDPAYIGMTGPARIMGLRTEPVPLDDNGLNPDQLEEVVRKCLLAGRPRAVYDVPDFNNPLGSVLPRERRKALLAICRKYGMFFIEDNAYGRYAYEGERLPTLKALDEDGTVLYIGTFSKTLFPGLRLGYLVADQRVQGTGELLAKELSKVKSFLTVNTPPLMQAIVGGVLLERGGFLQQVLEPKIQHLRRNRDVMLQSLATAFADMGGLVFWNRPNGGFFITVTLPFSFGKEELSACAADFGVIVCPMRFFTIGPGWKQQIRLSFSYLEEEQIRVGVQRLAMYVRERMGS